MMAQDSPQRLKLAPAGAAHGFVPDWQTWPTVALPFGMPPTDHVTVAVRSVRDVRGERSALADSETSPSVGVTLTVIRRS